MACSGSGCCASAPAEAERDHLDNEDDSSSCNDGCCDGDVCCEQEPQQKETPKTQQPVTTKTEACQAQCCEETVSTAATTEPDCCKDKPSPCCDASCLDRLAARECKQQHRSTTCSDKASSSTACKDHSKSVRAKYAAKLEALGCLCRALLALGQESCCAPVQKSSLERRKRCSARSTSASRKSLDSCCARVEEACCSPTEDTCSRKAENHKLATPLDAQNRDLEAGREQQQQHVILSVSGMTCTGCETKLNRTLGGLASVGNLKTSLVLSRAEFDIDPSLSSVSDILQHLERTTEFKCEVVNSHQGSSIDLITPCDAADFVKRDWPIGVKSVTVVDKKIFNVVFDANVVGARHLIEKGWEDTLQLAPLRADPTLDVGSRHVRHVGYWTIVSAVLTVPVLVMAWAPLPNRDSPLHYGIPSLILASLVQVLIAGPFYPKALKALIFTRVIEMDLLIVLSTTSAYVFSVVSFAFEATGKPLSTGEFFETSTLLVTLIMVGRYVAALSRQKAVESISVRSVQATTALLSEDNATREIDVRLLQYGDVFKVLPDSKIPTDGTVIAGSSEVDESLVTGESRPVEKYSKSPVIAGSLNGAGTLLVRLDRLPGENTISAIASMVDEAKLSKPKLQDLADRVASYFVPVVIALACVTFCIWIAVGVAVQHKTGSEAVIQAVTFAITVLIVSCPCAVGLAVPMVIVIASGVAAERGIIIKSASTIETAYKTKHVVLDKTGTLTDGRLNVVSQVYLDENWDPAETKSLLLALLADNKHPVAAAVLSTLQADNESISASPDVTNIQILTGKGIQATTTSGHHLCAGNTRWLNLATHPQIQPLLLTSDQTVFCLTVNHKPAAIFALSPAPLRPSALPLLAALHRRNITVHILTGDDHLPATLSHLPGRARCSPADKQAYIRALAQRPVLFCGDGTNDAAALAQADIGVHMGGGANTEVVARSAADVVLLQQDLGAILTLLDLSRAATRRMKGNFVWSGVYNLCAVLLAAGVGGGGRVRIPPAFAGLGEVVSVVPVVVAAVALKWVKV